MVEPLIIRRVKLENFISHRSTEIEFIRGVNVFIGPNGAGKSSIFEAIFYALTGKGWRTNVSNLINKNASTATVELEFSIGNDVYVLRRRIGGPGTILLRNGKMIARDQKGVDKALEELLGISPEKIENLVLIMQGGITRLFTEEKPKKRKEIIDTLLGIQEYMDAFEKLKEVKITPKTKYPVTLSPHVEGRGSLPRTIKMIQETITKTYEEIIGKKNKILEEIGELEKEISEREELARKEKLEEKAKQVEELNNKYTMLSSEIKGLKTSLEKILNDIKSREDEKKEVIGNIESMEKEISGINEKIKILGIEDKIADLEKKYMEYKYSMDTLETQKKRLEELNKVYEEITELEKKYKESLEELERRRENVKKEIEELSSEKEKLSSEKSRVEEKIASAKSRREEAMKIVDEVIKRVKELGVSPPEDPSRLPSLVEDIRKKLEEELEKLDREREKLGLEKEKIEVSIREVDDKIKLLRESKEPTCPLCGQPLDEQHREKIIRELEEKKTLYINELGRIEIKLVDVKNEIKAVEKKLEVIPESLIDQLKRAVKDLVEAEAEEKKLVETLNDLGKRIEEIVSRIKELRKTEEELDNAIKDVSRLETLKKGFNREEYEALKNNVKQLEEKTTRLFDEINSLTELIAGYLGLSGKEVEEVIDNARKALEEARVLREKKVELETRLVELRKRLEALNEEIERLDNEKKVVEEKINELESEKKKIEEELNKAKEAFEKLHALEKELAGLKEKLEAKKKELEEQDKALEELRREVNEINKAIRKVYILKWIRENIFHSDGAPKLLRARYVRLLSSLIEDLLGKFNIEYKEAVVDEEYNVRLRSINYPGKEIDIKSISGGEQVAVNLVALLALHKLVIGGRIGFMALDEPTAHLDSDRRIELIELLREFQGGKIIPQLLIVTHDENVREVGDKIFRVRKTNGYSQVEEIPLEKRVVVA